MKIKSIVQCARTIEPGGGVSGVAYNLEQQFKKLGYESKRFTLKDVGLSEKSIDSGLIINKLKLLRDVVTYSILGSIKLKKYHKKDNEIVICHTDAIYGDIYVMHGLHKAMIARSKNKVQKLLRNPLHLFLLVREEIRYSFNIHKVIVALTPEDKQDIINFYGVDENKIVVIPNGVDTERFKPIEGVRNEIRSQLNIKEEDFVVSFVGHEFERKGLRYLLSAIRQLREAGKDVHIIIAGKDSLDKVRRSLEGIEDLVHYIGFSREIEKYYNASNLFVLPSSFEAMALVGLEAMACGLPVLMTRVGGANQYLHEGENGYFIEQDARDIVLKIEHLINNPEKLKSMSSCARQTAERFSWEIIAHKYIELINKVAEGSIENV